MTAPERHVRMYRRLVAVYPKAFRQEYGEDMVLLFCDLLHDEPTHRVWSRTLRDATKSIVIQRLETVMSKNSMLRPLAFAAAAATALIAFSALGIQNIYVFVLTVAGAALAVVAALIYWQANRAYVEPSAQLHRYWLRVFGSGAALIALVNVGSGIDIEAPWLLLFGSVILGAMLVALGLILGVWHGADRLRAARAA
jgi:hypothetical protein